MLRLNTKSNKIKVILEKIKKDKGLFEELVSFQKDFRQGLNRNKVAEKGNRLAQKLVEKKIVINGSQAWDLFVAVELKK